MGNFINLGNAAFTLSRNSEYVDKSGLITVVNSTIDTEHMFSCVTRSRRFGKSMAAKMLCAYYDKSCEFRHLGYGFADLVFKPRENVSKPALIVELKQGHSAEEAIKQIKERKYTDQVREYSNDILLVGINYDEKSKHHSCIIEKA